MPSRAFAVFVGWFLLPGAAAAADGVPEWLPPPTPRHLNWDLKRDVQISRPGQDFSDLLLQISRASSEPSWRSDTGRLKLNRESNLYSAKVSSSLELPDARAGREAPYLARDWWAEESLSLSLPAVESVFVFGDFNSSGDYYTNQQLRMKGKTGLGLKWAPFSGSELQVRTGRVVNYADNQPRSADRSQLSVELQAKLDVFGPWQLKYSGEALPALVQAERHTVLQDLKIALPLGTNREFHLGAKYRWEDLNSTPWIDRAQLYMGLKFQH